MKSASSEIRYFIRWLPVGATLATSACSSLLYQPTRVLHYDPGHVGLAPQNIELRSEDGTTLHAWYLDADLGAPPLAWIAFFHGNAENASSHYLSMAWVLSHGIDYAILDYRGFGRSQGAPDPEGTVRDGIAFLEWARARSAGAPLIVYAQSLGGAVALRALAELGPEFPVALVVLDSTFLSYRDAARFVLSRHSLTSWLKFAVPLAVSDAWAPRDALDRLPRTRWLVVHGDADPVVGFALGQELFAALPEPKEFHRVPAGLHTDGLWRPDFGLRRLLLRRIRGGS